ncbi:MAG TPA: DUF2188 domain-containing protein [Longimicrobium sp.]|uniref:DUF2188 domain-containing protein n=1 Tax=Longimicrobium sp. TaxID=2029185 RepID=UPI002EDB63C6
MSPTAGMREKPRLDTISHWHVLPIPGGGWHVFDGGTPTPVGEFARKKDAVALAREKAAASNAGQKDPKKHRRVIISPRAIYKTEIVGNVERFVPLPGEPPPRRAFGSLAGRVWMSPDFDDPLPEFEEEDE